MSYSRKLIPTDSEQLHEVVIPNPIIGYWVCFWYNATKYRIYIPYQPDGDVQDMIRGMYGLAPDIIITTTAQTKYRR